jgi:hypothetical protein
MERRRRETIDRMVALNEEPPCRMAKMHVGFVARGPAFALNTGSAVYVSPR